MKKAARALPGVPTEPCDAWAARGGVVLGVVRLGILWAQESFAASKCAQPVLSTLLSTLDPNFVTLRRNDEKCVYSWGRGVGTIP